jgi:hypothetical protein
MRIQSGCINLFFGLFLWLCLGAGCATGDDSSGSNKDSKEKKDEKPEKQATTIEFRSETESVGMGTGRIKVFRAHPVTLNVERNAFVDGGFVEEARVIDGIAGPLIYVRFNTAGALRLQMATVTKPGRRMAIYSRWTEGRWLAAPLMSRPVENGEVVFTPDATREEAERIVRGLNNVAIKLKNQPKPDKKVEQAAKKKQEKAKSASKVARETEGPEKSEEEMFLK